MVSAAIAVLRWWLSRRSGPRPINHPLRRFLQWIDLAKRLEIQNAAEQRNQETNQRIQEYVKELVIDLDFCQTQNSTLRARVRELRRELDGCGGSGTGSTATPGRKIRRRKVRARPSDKPRTLKTR